jgi:hypothetical protein
VQDELALSVAVSDKLRSELANERALSVVSKLQLAEASVRCAEAESLRVQLDATREQQSRLADQVAGQDVTVTEQISVLAAMGDAASRQAIAIDALEQQVSDERELHAAAMQTLGEVRAAAASSASEAQRLRDATELSAVTENIADAHRDEVAQLQRQLQRVRSAVSTALQTNATANVQRRAFIKWMFHAVQTTRQEANSTAAEAMQQLQTKMDQMTNVARQALSERASATEQLETCQAELDGTAEQLRLVQHEVASAHDAFEEARIAKELADAMQRELRELRERAQVTGDVMVAARDQIDLITEELRRAKEREVRVAVRAESLAAGLQDEAQVVSRLKEEVLRLLSRDGGPVDTDRFAWLGMSRSALVSDLVTLADATQSAASVAPSDLTRSVDRQMRHLLQHHLTVVERHHSGVGSHPSS